MQMRAIKTKQNELDAKFASMLGSQHGHTQALNEIKSLFSKFLGLGKKKHINSVQMEPKSNSGQELQLPHSLSKETSMLNDMGPREAIGVGSGNEKSQSISLGKNPLEYVH